MFFAAHNFFSVFANSYLCQFTSPISIVPKMIIHYHILNIDRLIIFPKTLE